jgi:hypothetical protein
MQGKITREEAKYILGTYAPIRGHGKIGNHQGAILTALGLMRGNPVHMGCNCELGALARICNDMFEQNREEIEAIANSVIENESTETGV